MNSTTRLTVTVLFLSLAGCAADDAATRSTPLDQMLSQAVTASKHGEHDKALAALRAAVQAHPAEKAPWVNIAQLNFDQGKYSEAIGAAVEALQRDSHDKLANSIVAVSGLRLTTAALAELAQSNNLSGNVRAEAQELAKLLRTSLGEEVLVPQAGRPSGRSAMRKASAPAPSRPAAGADPFGALK